MSTAESLRPGEIEAPPVTRVEVPLSTYRVLEQRIREVRLAVFRCAARMARDNMPSPATGRIRVSRVDIESALKDVAGRPDLSTGENTIELPIVPDPCYSWLERRLDALRSLVIHVANRLASTKIRDTTTASYVTLAPETMDRAWQYVWNDRHLRYTTLTRREEPSTTSAEVQMSS